MTVRVRYSVNGEEGTVDFDNEREANIFMTGLRHHDRGYSLRFEGVSYPDKAPDSTERWDGVVFEADTPESFERP